MRARRAARDGGPRTTAGRERPLRLDRDPEMPQLLTGRERDLVWRPPGVRSRRCPRSLRRPVTNRKPGPAGSRRAPAIPPATGPRRLPSATRAWSGRRLPRLGAGSVPSRWAATNVNDGRPSRRPLQPHRRLRVGRRPRGSTRQHRALPGSGLRAVADGPTPRRTQPSTGRRAHRRPRPARPAGRCATTSTPRRPRGPAGDPRTGRTRAGASGRDPGLGDTIRRWRRRAGTRWSLRRPSRRPGRRRGRRWRSGGRDRSGPSGPCRRRVGGPRWRRSRRGVGGGSGWWPWC
jgi:hypothetical protein